MNAEMERRRVTRQFRRSLSGVMTECEDLAALRRFEHARYMEFATQAALHEREGRYSDAAEGWGEALKTARGENLDWCQSRLTLCLIYARSPHFLRTSAERVAAG